MEAARTKEKGTKRRVEALCVPFNSKLQAIQELKTAAATPTAAPTQAHNNGAMQARHGLISLPVVDPNTAPELNRGFEHHSKCFDSE